MEDGVAYIRPDCGNEANYQSILDVHPMKKLDEALLKEIQNARDISSAQLSFSPNLDVKY